MGPSGVARVQAGKIRFKKLKFDLFKVLEQIL